MKSTICITCRRRLNKTNRKNDTLCIECFEKEQEQWRTTPKYGLDFYFDTPSIMDDESRLEQLENLFKLTGRGNDRTEEAEQDGAA